MGMSLIADEWSYTDAGSSRRYFRNNAVVHIGESIYSECRWETFDPAASGVASDVWEAMASADAADGFVWRCPHCGDPDPDGEMHVYCQAIIIGRPALQDALQDAVREFSVDADQLRRTLRDILAFDPPDNMTREDVIAAYREHARRCLGGGGDTED
ncbi:MAG: hypothetical protein EBT97_08785 [Actinobacteria bacterium]|nr:hypothetical protein [Actinomycetota bacterium]